MFVGPLSSLCGRLSERHPLLTMSRTNGKQIFDFWGPCLIISIYGAVLWLCRVKDVPWIYAIWSLTAVFNHLVCRVFLNSKLTMHSALLGFSVAPLIPFSAVLVILRPQAWIVFLVEVVAILWATASAAQSYWSICHTSSENKHKLWLLLPSTLLMQLYLVSLMPVGRH